MNLAIAHLPRWERRQLIDSEHSRRKSGDWGPWEFIPLPDGAPGRGWCKQVRAAHKNKVFCVLDRPLTDVTHLAVTSLSGVRPTWHEMQRIKNEIAGFPATAVEVYPPAHEVVDEADMFHIWVVAPLPFSIYRKGASE
jgi:hypothetical protein